MANTFKGGVHLKDNKQYSAGSAIVDAPVQDELAVSLQQHLGAPATPVVKEGDAVKRGQLIGKPSAFISLPVHSPVSGTVKAIAKIPSPVGGMVTAVIIANDRADTWAEGCNQPRDTANLSGQEIRAMVAEAGVAGMGGAAFPSHVKLQPADGKPVDVLVLNGVECEPYLTCDYRLMLESPQTIIAGMRLMMKAAGVARGIIGVEDNKPDALEALRRAAEASGGGIEAMLLPEKYPQGSEKQLIYACTGREVPSGKLPADVGVVVQNVATAHAVYEAVALGRPVTERIVCVTGPGFAKPGNLRVRLGTRIGVLMELCGFKANEAKKLILGGPMMGMAHCDQNISVGKGMGGILALVEDNWEEYRDCVRCGVCVRNCPMGLMPAELSIFSERRRFNDALENGVLDCIECGVCAHGCPSRRPIVQFVKLAKSELRRIAEAEKAKKMQGAAK